jgi:hypothetical protein
MKMSLRRSTQGMDYEALGCYSYNNLKENKTLKYYKIRNKTVPNKILNNLKYYFYSKTDGSFEVKVVYKENTGRNLLVKYHTYMKTAMKIITCLPGVKSIPQCQNLTDNYEMFYIEVALENFDISLMRILYLKKTLNRKGLVTFGNSTFNVNELYRILLDISSNKIKIYQEIRGPDFNFMPKKTPIISKPKKYHTNKHAHHANEAEAEEHKNDDKKE